MEGTLSVFILKFSRAHVPKYKYHIILNLRLFYLYSSTINRSMKAPYLILSQAHLRVKANILQLLMSIFYSIEATGKILRSSGCIYVRWNED